MSVITAARRSVVAPRGGALAAYEVHQIAAPVIQACLADAGISATDVDELIVSNALGAGGNPARLCALAAGLPEQVAGLSIDRQCAGGLDAVLLAAAMVDSGQADIVVAGGVESYSRRPLRARGTRSHPEFYDTPPFAPPPWADPDMAKAADRLGITRARADSWAVESHAKAMAAKTRMSGEIVEIGDTGLEDHFTRALSPRLAARATVICGGVTHANTAVEADGAAFLVICRDDAAQRPMVRIAGGKTLGADTALPGLAPLAAINALGPVGPLAQVELMEAFAAQALAVVDGAGWHPSIVNPRGGALARGHPVGASGAILAVRLARDLSGTGARGLATIAAAGGVGTALLFEAV